jgi:hypothetical protein
MQCARLWIELAEHMNDEFLGWIAILCAEEAIAY